MAKKKEIKEIKNKPEKKFSVHPVSTTIWKNIGKTQEGEKVQFRTVSMQRRYKDKNDEWQNTNTLQVNDLPKAVLTLNKAYECLVLRDKKAASDQSIFEKN